MRAGHMARSAVRQTKKRPVGAPSQDNNEGSRPSALAARSTHASGELEDQLIGQEILALVYVLVGLALGAAPIVYLVVRHGAEVGALFRSIPRSSFLVVGCLLAAGAIFILDGPAYLAGSLAFSLALAAFTANERGRTFLLCLIAIGAAGTMLYWKFDDAHVLKIDLKDLAFLFLSVAIITLLTFIKNIRMRYLDIVITLAIFIFIAQHTLNMSVLLNNDVYTAIRHHWGAYIGPSETVLSGARILYDIPAQYGLGPTLLIASACGNNCWVGMYWITTSASVLYALLILASAALLVRRVDNSFGYGATLAAAAAACMVWTSYPPLLAGPWSFPSTGGLRFAPLAALLLFIIWRETRPAEAAPSRFYGHALWCVGALWAPESAFYLSFVWWPYLLWRAGSVSTQPLRAAAFVGIEIAAVVALLVGAFVAVFYLAYGLAPSLDLYIAYVVNPTGPQPPNPLGTFWFFAFTMIAGISAAVLLLRNRHSSSDFAKLFVCILSLFAVFSYYIGRSHDNNILNLMPFLVLVLTAVQSLSPLSALSKGARVALASTLAFLMFFGWSAWRQTTWSDYANSDAAASMAYVRGQTAEQTGAAAIPTSVGYPDQQQGNEQTAQKSRIDGANPADAARAVFYVSSVRGEPLIKIDDGLDMAPIGPRAWSAIHDPIDFYFLPDALVAKMIDRTMRRIKSPGWLIIGKHVDAVPETARWQRLLENSYKKTEELDFGAYHAIRYAPNLL
jgi:hypothetical protein